MELLTTTPLIWPLSDKDSSPPTQPASPKDTTFDVRSKLAKGKITKAEMIKKKEARKQRIAEAVS